jgi:hypothetical protein
MLSLILAHGRSSQRPLADPFLDAMVPNNGKGKDQKIRHGVSALLCFLPTQIEPFGNPFPRNKSHSFPGRNLHFIPSYDLGENEGSYAPLNAELAFPGSTAWLWNGRAVGSRAITRRQDSGGVRVSGAPR